MDTESIKLVVEAMSRLGENAQAAFITWVIVDNVAPLLGGVIGALTLGFVVRTITKAVKEFHESDNAAMDAVKRMRDAAKIGSPGGLDRRETQAVTEKFLAMLSKEAANA